jgi:sugar phosphate permease
LDLSRWHIVTIALLALGYSGYYFCRSDLGVVLPELIRDLEEHWVSANQAQIALGMIASAGTIAYALGRFIFGAVADMLAAGATSWWAWPVP